MKKEHEQKVLEVISLLSGKNLLNDRFFITIDGSAKCIKDKTSDKKVLITILYNQVVKVSTGNQLSAFILQHLIVNGKITIPNQIAETFTDLDDYLIDEITEVYKDDILSLRKAFNLALKDSEYKKQSEVIEYYQQKLEIEKELEENNITLKRLYVAIELLKPGYFDLKTLHDYKNYEEELDKISKLPKCEHEKLQIKHSPNKNQIDVLSFCSDCGLSFNVNMITRTIFPYPCIRFKPISLSDSIEVQKNLIKFSRDKSIIKLAMLIGYIEDNLNEKYQRMLVNSMRAYERMSGLKVCPKIRTWFGLSVKIEERICIYILGEKFRLSTIMDDYFLALVENTIIDTINYFHNKVNQINN